MFILASDTSTKKAHVAILDDETVLAEVSLNTGRNHGETILPAVHELLSMAGREIGEIDLFALTVGPGSFTGIRVGVSTCKGLALALEKPVVNVSTLDALAMNVSNFSGTICPMLDARGEEIYAALYRAQEQGVIPEKIGEDRAIAPAEFLEGLKGQCVFLGDGAVRYEALIRKMLRGRSFFVPPYQNDIRAGAVGLLGMEKFRRGEVINAAVLTPQYIRGSYADFKR